MATIGFEEKLWASADKLRNNMDAAEYKLSDVASNIIDKIQSNNIENEGLIRLRDSLLPKLMSEEIKIK